MRCREVIRQKQRLDDLFKKSTFFSSDLELHSHWAQYLCVLVYGLLEVGIREVLCEYSRNRTQGTPNVGNFIERRMRKFLNPKMNNILELVSNFSPDWESELRVFCEGKYKDHIDSIVNNRHNIAHGQSVGVTINTVHEYYSSILAILEKIEELCDS